MVPILGALLVLPGCGGGEEKKPPKKGGGDGTQGQSDKKTELASTGWGTIEGIVTLASGKPPASLVDEAKIDNGVKNKADKTVCLAGLKKGDDVYHNPWKVTDGKVADVVIFLKPPDGKYFKPKQDDIDKVKKEVVIDQPYCAFRPHIAVMFTKYFDSPAEEPNKATGQKLKVLNSSTVTHNTNYSGTQGFNPGQNLTIPPKEAGKETPYKIIELNPDPNPVRLKCDAHGFMEGKVWVFDHPYSAITDKDGHYKIEKAPAGAEIAIIAWHDAYGRDGFVNGAAGDKITVEDGKTLKKDFSVKLP
jgi:hypothetical protein